MLKRFLQRSNLFLFPLAHATFLMLALIPSVVASGIEKSDRGAIISTENYEAEIRNGLLMSFINRHTGENFFDPLADASKITPHLPGGIGVMDTPEAILAAQAMMGKPWWEMPHDGYWPNQRYPDERSSFSAEPGEDGSLTLTYRDLTDGRARYPEAIYRLAVKIDPEQGDLLLTPSGESPGGAVYAPNLATSSINLGISVEAPIWDGVRLTREMKPRLWAAFYGSHWDYAFVALNGRQKGAVGIWAQDKELLNKTLFYLLNDQGLSLSFNSIPTLPFEEEKQTRGVTWRLQAFSDNWVQAVDRYREWRLGAYPIAKRPPWVNDISFVNSGVNAAPQWANLLDSYFEGRNLDRTVTFAPVIRRRAFDTMHWDNEPYAEFSEQMAYWKEKGPRLMAYLNPMTMWRRGEPPNKAEQEIEEMAKRTTTISPFQESPFEPTLFTDKHHLGFADWQRWFLDWVNVYIQKHQANGVYHDETYIVPIDRRGPIEGMNPIQAMQRYAYLAATENPDSIHGTEHLSEANIPGMSLGIGSGILWGTAEAMRHQRIKHASPVSNALHYPDGVLFGFPHFSDVVGRGSVIRHFHWGMDLMERRGEIAGSYLQNSTLLSGRNIPYSAWRGELWLDRKRATTFVWEGLRPVFPANWNRSVRSYFQSKEGGDFRYVNRPWGSAFVKVQPDGAEQLIYGRIHGVQTAEVDGGPAGWPLYGEHGPIGLNPERYYVLDPDVERPPITYSTSNHYGEVFYEAYAEPRVSGNRYAWIQFEAIASIGGITRGENLIMNTEKPPHAAFVNGKAARVRGNPEEGAPFKIHFKFPADIVLIHEPGSEDLSKALESMQLTWTNDEGGANFDSAWLSANGLKTGETRLKNFKKVLPGFEITKALTAWRTGRCDIHMTVAAPAEEGEHTLLLYVEAAEPLEGFTVNGVKQDLVLDRTAENEPIEVKISAGETALLGLQISAKGQAFACGLAWKSKE